MINRQKRIWHAGQAEEHRVHNFFAVEAVSKSLPRAHIREDIRAVFGIQRIIAVVVRGGFDAESQPFDGHARSEGSFELSALLHLKKQVGLTVEMNSRIEHVTAAGGQFGYGRVRVGDEAEGKRIEFGITFRGAKVIGVLDQRDVILREPLSNHIRAPAQRRAR